jgi:hypothetical protein
MVFDPHFCRIKIIKKEDFSNSFDLALVAAACRNGIIIFRGTD